MDPRAPQNLEVAEIIFILGCCLSVGHSSDWANMLLGQLDVTCFIISLFTAQHVSNVSTSIFRSLRLIVDLFHVLHYGLSN